MDSRFKQVPTNERKVFRPDGVDVDELVRRLNGLCTNGDYEAARDLASTATSFDQLVNGVNEAFRKAWDQQAEAEWTLKGDG